MTRSIARAVIFAAVVLTTQAFADDKMASDSMSSSPMTASQQQAMKECMAKQKANNNSNMSADEMKKACSQDMQKKQQKDLSTGNQGTPPK